MEINLNDMIRVKLNELGLERLSEINKEFELIADRKSKKKIDKDGYVSMQLWAFIKNYGDMIGLGKEAPIENAEIIIESKYKNIDDEAEIEKFMMDNNLYIYSKYVSKEEAIFLAGAAASLTNEEEETVLYCRALMRELYYRKQSLKELIEEIKQNKKDIKQYVGSVEALNLLSYIRYGSGRI